MGKKSVSETINAIVSGLAKLNLTDEVDVVLTDKFCIVYLKNTVSAHDTYDILFTVALGNIGLDLCMINRQQNKYLHGIPYDRIEATRKEKGVGVFRWAGSYDHFTLDSIFFILEHEMSDWRRWGGVENVDYTKLEPASKLFALAFRKGAHSANMYNISKYFGLGLTSEQIVWFARNNVPADKVEDCRGLPLDWVSHLYKSASGVKR
jgi:hypothetical protein